MDKNKIYYSVAPKHPNNKSNRGRGYVTPIFVKSPFFSTLLALMGVVIIGLGFVVFQNAVDFAQAQEYTIDPAIGPIGGGNTISISGNGFKSGKYRSINGSESVPVGDYTINIDTRELIKQDLLDVDCEGLVLVSESDESIASQVLDCDSKNTKIVFTNPTNQKLFLLYVDDQTSGLIPDNNDKDVQGSFFEEEFDLPATDWLEQKNNIFTSGNGTLIKTGEDDDFGICKSIGAIGEAEGIRIQTRSRRNNFTEGGLDSISLEDDRGDGFGYSIEWKNKLRMRNIERRKGGDKNRGQKQFNYNFPSSDWYEVVYEISSDGSTVTTFRAESGDTFINDSKRKFDFDSVDRICIRGDATWEVDYIRIDKIVSDSPELTLGEEKNQTEVFFGENIADGTIVQSPTNLTTIVPASTLPLAYGEVDVIIKYYNSESTISSGYEYENPASVIYSTSPTQDFYTGGQEITIQGDNFEANGFERDLIITNTEKTAYDIPVVVIIDTKDLVKESKLSPDCSNLVIRDKYNYPVPYFIEGECNTSKTYVWMRAPYLSVGNTTFKLQYGGYTSDKIVGFDTVFDSKVVEKVFYDCPNSSRCSRIDESDSIREDLFEDTADADRSQIIPTITDDTLSQGDLVRYTFGFKVATDGEYQIGLATNDANVAAFVREGTEGTRFLTNSPDEIEEFETDEGEAQSCQSEAEDIDLETNYYYWVDVYAYASGTNPSIQLCLDSEDESNVSGDIFDTSNSEAITLFGFDSNNLQDYPDVIVSETERSGAPIVMFADTPARDVTFVNENELRVLTPHTDIGTVDVIYNSLTTYTAVDAFTFTQDIPTISQVSPAEVMVGSLDTVQLTGSKFDIPGNRLVLEVINASSQVENENTNIELKKDDYSPQQWEWLCAITHVRSSDLVQLATYKEGGCDNPSIKIWFKTGLIPQNTRRYYYLIQSSEEVQSSEDELLAQEVGGYNQGDVFYSKVFVRPMHFMSLSEDRLQYGQNDIEDVDYVSKSILRFRSTGSAGTYDLSYTNSSDTSTTMPNALTFLEPLQPTIQTVVPGSIRIGTQPKLTITGSNYLYKTIERVLIGDKECLELSVISDSIIECRAPIDTLGPKSIRIVYDDGIFSQTPEAITYESNVVESGLQFYYDASILNAGIASQFDDLSGNNNNAIVTSASQTSNPVEKNEGDKSIKLDRTQKQYIRTAVNSNASDTFSIESWFRHNSDSDTTGSLVPQKVVSMARNGEGSSSIAYGIEDGVITILYYKDGLPRTYDTGYKAGDAWHHILLTYENSILKIYINGVGFGEITDFTPILSDAPITIGASNDGENFNYDGDIAKVRFYNRALNIEEVETNFRNEGENFDFYPYAVTITGIPVSLGFDNLETDANEMYHVLSVENVRLSDRNLLSNSDWNMNALLPDFVSDTGAVFDSDNVSVFIDQYRVESGAIDKTIIFEGQNFDNGLLPLMNSSGTGGIDIYLDLYLVLRIPPYTPTGDYTGTITVSLE